MSDIINRVYSKEIRNHPYRGWIAVIGSGLALSPIHNQALTKLTTTGGGDTLVFIPAIGYVLIIVGTGFFMLDNWDKVKAVGIGSWWVVAPMLIVLATIALAGTNLHPFSHKFAPALMAVCLFCLYMVARVVGREIFLPLGVGAAVACLGIFIFTMVHPMHRSHGGYIFERNFDIFVGYVMLGAALFFHSRLRWVMVSLALVALFLSGAPEMLLPLGVLGLAVVFRKDWSRETFYAVVPLAIVFILVMSSGAGHKLYSYAWDSLRNAHTVEIVNTVENTDKTYSPLGWRATVIKEEMSHVRPLGDGYNVTGFTEETVHNVPLIIVQQAGYPGILAALAWLFLLGYGFFKTRWKYIFLLLFTLGILDHYVWTQLSPLIYIVLGASTAATAGSDLFFKQEEKQEVAVGV